jgi:hypothetical protein
MANAASKDQEEVANKQKKKDGTNCRRIKEWYLSKGVLL